MKWALALLSFTFAASNRQAKIRISISIGAVDTSTFIFVSHLSASRMPTPCVESVREPWWVKALLGFTMAGLGPELW